MDFGAIGGGGGMDLRVVGNEGGAGVGAPGAGRDLDLGRVGGGGGSGLFVPQVTAAAGRFPRAFSEGPVAVDDTLSPSELGSGVIVSGERGVKCEERDRP